MNIVTVSGNVGRIKSLQFRCIVGKCSNNCYLHDGLTGSSPLKKPIPINIVYWTFGMLAGPRGCFSIVQTKESFCMFCKYDLSYRSEYMLCTCTNFVAFSGNGILNKLYIHGSSVPLNACTGILDRWLNLGGFPTDTKHLLQII